MLALTLAHCGYFGSSVVCPGVEVGVCFDGDSPPGLNVPGCCVPTPDVLGSTGAFTWGGFPGAVGRFLGRFVL